jgi:SNW domain-containing protein 1
VGDFSVLASDSLARVCCPQDEGLASGFGADDSYGVYDKGLFAEKAAKLYTGRGAGDDDSGAGAREGNTERFKADKGFAGTEGGGGGGGGGGRGAAPVQFESDKVEADPFDLDAFLTEVKGKGKR